VAQQVIWQLAGTGIGVNQRRVYQETTTSRLSTLPLYCWASRWWWLYIN